MQPETLTDLMKVWEQNNKHNIKHYIIRISAYALTKAQLADLLNALAEDLRNNNNNGVSVSGESSMDKNGYWFELNRSPQD